MKNKPRFESVEDMVSDFNFRIRYLDKDNPKDPTILDDVKPQAKPLTESKKENKAPLKAEVAYRSKYSNPQKAVDSFKVLAGLTEREVTVWNPGWLGNTRYVSEIMEDYGMDSAELLNEDLGVSVRKDPPTVGPKEIHRALSSSHRLIANQHAAHSYMHELPPDAQSHKKAKLAQMATSVASHLRGVMDKAPVEVADKLHALAMKHEKHAKIYAKGGRPKLEAIEAIYDILESIDYSLIE